MCNCTKNRNVIKPKVLAYQRDNEINAKKTGLFVKIKLLFTEYSILNVIWDIVTFKLKLATERLAQARMNSCLKCGFIRIYPLKSCSICGCLLKLKTRVYKSSCPEGKW